MGGMMAREQKIIRDRELLKAWIRERFELDADVKPFTGKATQWRCLHESRSSAGPIIWVQNRLMESGQWHQAGCQGFHEEDNWNPIFGRNGEGAKVDPSLAKPQFWNRYRWQVIEPIDLTAMRVAGRRDHRLSTVER
jgi:hypothetical protein